MSESGRFYSIVIDPLLKNLRKQVAAEIQRNDAVIDVACGTGAQLFEIAGKASKVTGVDLSASMIGFAQQEAAKQKVESVEFLIGDAADLAMFKNQSFDVAILSMALHQFPPRLHAPVLAEMKRIAPKMILLDYAVPLPRNMAGAASRIAEFLAGSEHHRNFKSYCKLGGLNEILGMNGLAIDKTVSRGKGAFRIVVCSVEK